MQAMSLIKGFMGTSPATGVSRTAAAGCCLDAELSYWHTYTVEYSPVTPATQLAECNQYSWYYYTMYSLSTPQQYEVVQLVVPYLNHHHR